MVTMDMGEDDYANLPEVETQCDHIGEKHRPITAGIEKDGRLVHLYEASEAPGSLQPEVVVVVVIDHA